MESLVWTLRTLNGFSLAAPVFMTLLFVLFMFWDYPILLPCLLALRALRGRRPIDAGTTPLSTLVVIPSLLRRRDELTSMMSTVDSVATNGYPGELLIVVSIDGTGAAPELYAELRRWAERQHYGEHTHLYATGTPARRGKPMAIDLAMEFVKGLVAQGVHPEFPAVYVSTDADADLGPCSLERIVHRLQRRNPFTGAPARAVAGALHVRGNDFWRGWRAFFTIAGQLNIQVARDYYVSNIGRYNIRWLPMTGVPGALYCTWTSIFLQIPRFMGYMRTLRRSDWLRWWVGIPAPKFSESSAEPIPELMAGDTDDTVSAYAATIARYEGGGRFSLDPPRTPLHAFLHLLRGVFVDRALHYEPEARVFTSSPVTIRSLIKQRRRWNTARIELTGRFWRSLGYHWTLGLPAIIVKSFMARSFLVGLYAYLFVPAFVWRSQALTIALLAYFTQLVSAATLTFFTLVMNGEMRYWRLSFAIPLSPVYTLVFKWIPAAIGFLHDVLLFGNVTGFAPESTLIAGGSERIAILFRIRRVALLAVRAVVTADVPLGAFWLGWRETPWTPNGFEGFTSGKKPRPILPPVASWFRAWGDTTSQTRRATDGQGRRA